MESTGNLATLTSSGFMRFINWKFGSIRRWFRNIHVNATPTDRRILSFLSWNWFIFYLEEFYVLTCLSYARKLIFQEIDIAGLYLGSSSIIVLSKKSVSFRPLWVSQKYAIFSPRVQLLMWMRSKVHIVSI